jgi:hypothetical protein
MRKPLRFSAPEFSAPEMKAAALAVITFFIIISLTSHAIAQGGAASDHPLITQAVDESQLTVLKGNKHPLAKPQFDLGAAPAALPMERMQLVLKRSADQEYALRTLLDNQQDKHSASYHKWLTPTEFGKQFGPADSDIQTVTRWLQSYGFQVGTTKGRTVLEFSGSAGQVQEAFHTAIHKYIVNGEQHWANASDPSIPTALTPAVAGVLTLHNFLKKPLIRYTKQTYQGKVRPGKRPNLTFSDGSHGMAPFDFATIYNSQAYNSGINGQGVAIGVVGRSDLYNSGQDVSDFRSQLMLGACCGGMNLIVNGADPGDLGGGEEGEATLDNSWSSAVAPGATIDFVVSATTNTADGVDLSEIYIIENNLSDIMTESFGGCEADSTSTEAAGVSALAEQAAAQGITYFVSSGDNGAEGCDDPDSEMVASGPVSVSLLASTPFNVAVGGTVFNDTANPTNYWSATNNNQESALSYIPENVWNDSCSSASCGTNANIFAGSGGQSIYFTKPTWQQVTYDGIQSDGTRDLPDVSLTADTHDGYVLCLEGSCEPNSQGEFFLYLSGGTSASAPSFAGIMALVNNQMATLNTALGPRQGLANFGLYRLAAQENSILSECNGSSTTALPTSNCIFNDVTVGNNAVPGELNYGSPTAQFQAGVGYDMASGLGSVNITNLVNEWNAFTFNPTTTTLALGQMTGIAHGSPVSVNVGVAPSSGTGTSPTGDVSLLASNSGSGTAVGFFTLAGGLAASSISDLPGGSYNVYANYSGDTTYSASSSNLVSVTVTPEASTTTTSVLGANSDGSSFPFQSGPFGSFVYLRADVAGFSGHGTPTGSVTFADSFGTIPGGNTFNLNSGEQFQNGSNATSPNGVLFDAGTHNLSASYSGDASFNPSSSAGPTQFTIQAGFLASIGSAQSSVLVSAPGSSGSTSVSVSWSTGFSGMISLACSGLPAGSACAFGPASFQATSKYATNTSTITVTTTAAAAASSLPPGHDWRLRTLAFGLMLFSVMLVGIPRRRRSPLLLAAVLGLIMFVPACGGGSSSGSGGSQSTTPPATATPAGSYNVVVSATSGSTTSTTGFTLVVE